MPEAPPHTQPERFKQAPEDDPPFWTTPRRHRMAWALVGILLVVLLAVVPPLVSINRYQRRVATAIAGSLGRPVHFDTLTLHLLPLPGITIENFVVGESPDFGAEPVMRANTVEARLRFGSLWRRRIEVSHISLDSPSINLVRRRSDGAWNLQSIFMQASQMNSAPTAQARAGSAPRFPYIEATDARINIKSDNDKLPFSFKEAQLALWLPEPNEWHLRLNGKPVRTDTDVSDVGIVRVDATLGRATELAAAPIDLSASWKPTPLGEAGKLTVGHDQGWRGEASAEATLKGTLGTAKLIADLHLLALRRADFVPEHTAELNAHCEATTGGLLRSLTDLRCAIPTSSDTPMVAAIEALRRLPQSVSSGETPDGAVKPEGTAKPGVLLVRGQVPDFMNWSNSDLDISLRDASPNYALAWLRLFSQRIPRALSVGGAFSLAASRSPLSLNDAAWKVHVECHCDLPSKELRDTQQESGGVIHWIVDADRNPESQPSHGALTVVAYLLAAETPLLEAKPDAHAAPDEPFVAESIIGEVSLTGYTVTYGSREAAIDAAKNLPPLGDGMPTKDAAGVLEVKRLWNGAQTWTTASTPDAHEPMHHHHAQQRNHVQQRPASNTHQ